MSCMRAALSLSCFCPTFRCVLSTCSKLTVSRFERHAAFSEIVVVSLREHVVLFGEAGNAGNALKKVQATRCA